MRVDMGFLLEYWTWVEHEKRNSISKSYHVLVFFNHSNTKALYWQEKSTLLMNESKKNRQFPNKNRTPLWGQDSTGKMRWIIITKTTMDVIFNLQIHSSNLTERRKRRVTRQQLIGNVKHTWKNIVFFQVCCYGCSLC